MKAGNPLNSADALNFIHSSGRRGLGRSLERISALLNAIGNPQDGLKFIHVAGTNGKGSVCRAVYTALCGAGYGAGLFISPFITDFCERISAAGQMISPQELADEAEFIKPFIEKLMDRGCTFKEFEIVTAMAMHYFKRKNCFPVILEAGIGGALDATNIISTPLVSVITAVSYDHTDVLGHTLTEIAREKSGIIKPGGITVCYPLQDKDVLDTLTAACEKNGNRLILPDTALVKITGESIDGTLFRYRENRIFAPLAGRHQVYNFMTAFETLMALREYRGVKISNDEITAGFAKTRFPARMEIACRSPLTIIDGAHNISAISAASDYVKRYLDGKRLIVVMGMMGDKNFEQCVETMSNAAQVLIATNPDTPRALPPATIAALASKNCRETYCRRGIGAALPLAFQKAGEDGAVLVCGSLYLAGEAGSYIRSLKPGTAERTGEVG